MDFQDTPEEAAYRAEVRAWLDANAPRKARSAGDRAIVTPDVLAAAKVWQARKAEAGYAAIAKPKALGGGGGTPMQEIIFNQEEEAFGAQTGIFGIGIGMCVPTVMAHGSEASKEMLVGPTVRGEKIWCQLFSEPSAGSDLAGLRTRAVKDGDEWVINGQKIWNSFAHLADYGILLTRTDPGAPKHKGMTMFWVDLKSPGIDIRPIHQVSGHSDFNEVFLSDVRIPDSQRLGEVDEGWKVALVTLMNERMSVMSSTRKPNFEEIMELARQLPGEGLKDAAFREQLADWYIRAEGLRFTRFRLLTALSRGEQPSAAASIGKILAANQLQEVAVAGTELQDQFGIISDPDLAPMDAIFQKTFLYSPAARLGGGTDEIMKNIIAERVLGLPGEIRVDKDTPFRDIPTGR